MKDKYQFTISSEELTIKPYFSYKMKLLIFAVLVVLVISVVPQLDQILHSDVRNVIYMVAGMTTLIGLYELIFKVNVKFLFDKRTHAIYKIIPPFPRQKLMTFDEMTIIHTTEHGEMEYAIAQKKNQFVKNYSISDSFGNSQKSQRREERYVNEILNPILEFVRS